MCHPTSRFTSEVGLCLTTKLSISWFSHPARSSVLLVLIGVLLYKQRQRRQASLLLQSIDMPTLGVRGHQHCPLHVYTPSRILLDTYRVTVVDTVEDCETFLQTHVPVPIRIVGMDCEWRGVTFNSSQQSHAEHTRQLELRESLVKGETNYVECLTTNETSEDGERESMTKDCPVALLQLAFSNGEVLLARLNKFKRIGEALKDLLAGRSVLKFGVGISNDVQRLTAGFGVQTIGCVDLQVIALRCGIRTGTSLQGLCEQLLSLEMDKPFNLRCGDWEAEHLSREQVEYAALDAIVALHILQALVELKTSTYNRRSAPSLTSLQSDHLSNGSRTYSLNNFEQTTTYLTSFSHLIGRSLEAWLATEDNFPRLLSLCQGVTDVRFKHRPSCRHPSVTDGVAPKKTSAYSVRRSRLYHNCRLLAPDGQLLSTMHKKKVEWYLERGLGSLVCEDPMTVRLHFEPAGRPGVDREYYLREKENICAVCGTDKNCVRKNIVPHEYRRYFPTHLKEHISHDVLLMCTSCHQLASHHSALLKQQIEAELGFYGDITSQKYKEDPHLRQVKNHARVLLKDTSSIPEERLAVLQGTVAHFHGVDPCQLTTEMIQEATRIDPRSMNSSYVSQSEQVVATIAQGGEDSLFQFQRRWRQHFLNTMDPKFLPDCWSVDHNPTC